MISGASDKLRQWLEMGYLSATDYQEAVKQVGDRPTGKVWWAFFQLMTSVLSTGALVFSLIFFIAYNWDDMSRLAKFALVEGALLLAVLGYFYRYKVKNDHSAVTGWFLWLIAMLIGGLLALFGQVYQTGADSWQLFFSWTLLITPIVLVSKFAPMWCLWLVLANTTMFLFKEQMLAGPFNSDYGLWFSCQLLFNSLLLMISEWLRGRGLAFTPKSLDSSRVASQIMVMMCIVVLILYWGSYSWRYNSAEILLPLWLLVVIAYYRFRVLDIIIISVCTVVMLLYVVYLFDRLAFEQSNDIERFFITSLVLLVLGGWATHYLRALAKSLPSSVSATINSHLDDPQCKEHGENPTLWQQLISLGLAAKDSEEPRNSVWAVNNITAVFSIVGVVAGILFLLALFSVFSGLFEYRVAQIIALVIGIWGCWYCSKQVEMRAVYYVPSVLMLMVAGGFLFLLLQPLDQKVACIVYGVVAFILMGFIKLKSLRFIFFVAGLSAFIALFDLYDIGEFFIVILSFAWLYTVFNEQQLLKRFDMPLVTVVSHGLLFMLVFVGLVWQEKYYLFVFSSQKLVEYSVSLSVPVVVSVSSLVAFFVCCYVTAKALGFVQFSRLFVAGLLVVVLLFCVPLVTLSLCIMLCGLYLQRRGWLVLGALCLICFISLFYYNLDATLNTKAIYLVYMGLVVMVLRFAVKHRFSVEQNEKEQL